MKSWFPIAAGLVLGAAGLFAVAQYSKSAAPEVDAEPRFEGDSVFAAGAPWRERFADVELQTHDGRTVSFYDDLIKDKIVALNFMYCGCTKF